MDQGAQVEAMTKTYDDLAKACLAAFELRDELLGRIGPGSLTAVQSLPEWTREDWRKHVTDPASPELCAEMDKVAKEDEKKEWYFSSVIATYWLEALAANCCARFHLDANRTASLSKIQLVRERELESVGRQRLAASAIIAAAGLLAVPVETFAAFDLSNDAYGFYRLGVVMAVVLALGLTLFPQWILLDYDREKTRRRTANAMTGVLLTYCAIRCRSDDWTAPRESSE
jgi:hypothetical protein